MQVTIKKGNSIMKLQFVDELPEINRRPKQVHPHVKIAKILRANPGRWAKWPLPIPTTGTLHARASQLRAGQVKNFPKGEFEARVRNHQLYIRALPVSEGPQVKGLDASTTVG